MKKLIMAILISPLFFNAALAEKNNAANVSAKNSTKAEQKAEAKRMVTRLHEIHDLATHTQLSITEKKQLRDEVQTIKKDLEKMEGVYLYLSLTAILIILLLILLI
jgi:hypothetical protein